MLTVKDDDYFRMKDDLDVHMQKLEDVEDEMQIELMKQKDNLIRQWTADVKGKQTQWDTKCDELRNEYEEKLIKERKETEKLRKKLRDRELMISSHVKDRIRNESKIKAEHAKSKFDGEKDLLHKHIEETRSIRDELLEEQELMEERYESQIRAMEEDHQNEMSATQEESKSTLAQQIEDSEKRIRALKLDHDKLFVSSLRVSLFTNWISSS
jgi:hypothetical protein